LRARLAIQFEKGYKSTLDWSQIQNTIAQVFALETAPRARGPEPRSPMSPAVVPPATSGLNLPATYTSTQAPTDQLQLNADYSFSLQQGGKTYQGTFTVNGNSLELTMSGSNSKSTATLQGDKLTDSGGQTWILQGGSTGASPDAGVLQNDDIIKMVKAGLDDGTITDKINSSKCRFDTSTDALIQLKQNGVSAEVTRAMIAAGK
jgi:hypothetical protein